MPDTFTHIALPFILRKKIRYQILFISLLIGTVLPDYFREFFSIILSMEHYGFTLQFHSLIGGFAVSLLLSSIVIKSQRAAIFTGLYSGYLLHLFLDLLQGYPCGNHIYIVFPWPHSFNLELIPESAWIFVFIISSSVFVMYMLWQVVILIKNRKQVSKTIT